MLRVVILDMDGTLVDTNYLHVEAWAQAFHAVHRPIPRAIIHRHIGMGGHLMLDALLGDEALARQVTTLHRECFNAIKHEGYPLPGARELITRLSSQHIAVWLATSSKPEELAHHVGRLDVKDHLSGMVSSADVHTAKPAPDIFQHTLRQAGGAPHDSLVIGDTIWDIQAARACGLRTIAVMTGGAFSRQELEEEGAMAVYTDCADLLASGFPDNVRDFHPA
jgi:HAD superfamily hydrolase (TIGR01509 family)